VTICTYNFTLFYLVAQPLKTNFPPKTTYPEQFILFIPMMEIKNPWILYTAPVATFFMLIIRKPFVMARD